MTMDLPKDTGAVPPPWKGGWRTLDRRVYTLSVAAFVRSSGRSASWIFLPLLLYVGYHLSLIQVGLLVSALVPLSVLVNLLGGVATDRYGRRWFAMVPPFGAAMVFFALYRFWDAGLGLMMVLWALNIVLINIQQPAQNAMLGDVTRPAERTVAFGVQRVFSNSGFALAPAVGGLLAASYGLPVVFLMSTVTAIGEGIVLLAFLKESFRGTASASRTQTPKGDPGSHRWGEGLRYPFRDRFLISFGVLGFALTVVTQQFGTPLTLFLGTAQHLPFAEIGLVYSMNGIVVVALQIPISWGVQHRKLLWMAVGALLYGTAFLVLDISPGFLIDLAAIFVLTLGEDITSPLQNAVLSGLSGPARRGSYFGAYNVFTSSAQAFAPALGTLLLGISNETLWLPIAALTVVVAMGYTLLYRSEAHVPEAPPGGAGPIGTPLFVTPATGVTGGKHTGYGHTGP